MVKSPHRRPSVAPLPLHASPSTRSPSVLSPRWLTNSPGLNSPRGAWLADACPSPRLDSPRSAWLADPCLVRHGLPRARSQVVHLFYVFPATPTGTPMLLLLRDRASGTLALPGGCVRHGDTGPLAALGRECCAQTGLPQLKLLGSEPGSASKVCLSRYTLDRPDDVQVTEVAHYYQAQGECPFGDSELSGCTYARALPDHPHADLLVGMPVCLFDLGAVVPAPRAVLETPVAGHAVNPVDRCVWQGVAHGARTFPHLPQMLRFVSETSETVPS